MNRSYCRQLTSVGGFVPAMRKWRRWVGLIGVAAALASLGTAAATERPVSIIILVADGDLGDHVLAHEKMSAFDRLRERAIAIDEIIGGPSPTAAQAALLTGEHEFASAVTHPDGPRRVLGTQRETLPETFGKFGYECGFFGVWRLGTSLPSRPEDRGFGAVAAIPDGRGTLGDRWGNSQESGLLRGIKGWKAVSANDPDPLLAAFSEWWENDSGAETPRFGWLQPAAAESGSPVHRRAWLTGMDRTLGTVLDMIASENSPPTVLIVVSSVGREPMVAIDGSGELPPIEATAGRAWCLLPGNSTEELGKAGSVRTIGMADLGSLVRGFTGGREKGVAAMRARMDEASEVLVFSHVGGWPENDPAARHRSDGFAVTGRGFRLSGLNLASRELNDAANHFETKPAEMMRLLAAYGAWWNSISVPLREPVLPLAGDPRQPLLRLSAADWWPLTDSPQPLDRALVAGQASLRRMLGQLADSPEKVPSVRGTWRFEAAQEGHFPMRFSLLPGEAGAAEIAKFGKLNAGTLVIREGPRETRLGILAGATSIEIGLDLNKGPVEIEAWFEGQLPGERKLGAMFVEIRRDGPRHQPELQLDLEQKLEKNLR